MHFKPGFGDVQIIAGGHGVHGGIVVNAFNGVVILVVVVPDCINLDAVVFAHEPLQKRGVQQFVTQYVKIVRT